MSFITSTNTPPKAERNHFAKTRIRDSADQDFLSALEHLLHLNTLDAGVFLVSLGVFDQTIESAPHISCVIESNDHATRFGFVQNIVRDNFQDDGETQSRGDFHRFGCSLG